MTSTERGGKPLTLAGWAFALSLIVVVMVFLAIRVTSDIGDISAGRVPPEGDFDRRYVLNPWLAYLHILPGMVYLLGAPLQLSARFRRNHLEGHRRLGRVLVVSGLVTAVFAIVIGIVMPFGLLAEASATVVFGVYFLTALVMAYRAIRSYDVFTHRRWMIRAFAVGVGVGMIRIVIGVGEAFGIGIDESFGAAFWIAFVTLAVLAEVWLAVRPDPPGYDARERLGSATPR